MSINPYLPHYRVAFASSFLFSPYRHQPALRLACPEGDGMGLPRSAYSTTNTLGPLYLPVGIRPCRTTLNTSEPPTYLLVQACQLLWLVKYHGSYEHSLALTIVSYPNPSPGWSFQERIHLTVSTSCQKALRGIVRKASYPSWMHHERMLP